MSKLDMREGADEKKFLSSLGLCARAGKVIFGVPMICEAMKKGGVTVIDTKINMDEFVLPMLPPGGSIEDIIVNVEGKR